MEPLPAAASGSPQGSGRQRQRWRWRSKKKRGVDGRGAEVCEKLLHMCRLVFPGFPVGGRKSLALVTCWLEAFVLRYREFLCCLCVFFGAMLSACLRSALWGMGWRMWQNTPTSMYTGSGLKNNNPRRFLCGWSSFFFSIAVFAVA